jgi:hypothetical protein
MIQPPGPGHRAEAADDRVDAAVSLGPDLAGGCLVVHGDVGRLGTQGRRVVASSDGHDHRHGLIAQSFDHGPEDVEVAVVDGAQSDVDERQIGQGVEPGWCLGVSELGGGRAHRHDGRDGSDLGVLEGGWTGVDVEVAKQPCEIPAGRVFPVLRRLLLEGTHVSFARQGAIHQHI